MDGGLRTSAPGELLRISRRDLKAAKEGYVAGLGIRGAALNFCSRAGI